MFSLPFYPNHEYGGKHNSACPDLGGASIGTIKCLSQKDLRFHQDFNAGRR